MKCKNLSNACWDEAIRIVVYLKNIRPTRCLDHKNPFEALYDSKPTVNNLRIFGCKNFAHIPKENKKKLDAKAIKCIFIRYCSEFKEYKLFDPSTYKVFASRDVIFHEQGEGNNEDNNDKGWQVLLEDEEVKEEKQQHEKAPSDMDTSNNEE
jgi:hypothetical protein